MFLNENEEKKFDSLKDRIERITDRCEEQGIALSRDDWEKVAACYREQVNILILQIGQYIERDVLTRKTLEGRIKNLEDKVKSLEDFVDFEDK